MSPHGEFISQTEPAASIHDSINARRSDLVQLESFAEENSADWRRNSGLPPQTAPVEANDDYSQK